MVKSNTSKMFAYRGVIVSSQYGSNVASENGFVPYKRLYSYKQKTFLYVMFLYSNPLKRVDQLDLDVVMTAYSNIDDFLGSFIFFLPKKIKACKLPVF